jgi:hypothetical protein
MKNFILILMTIYSFPAFCQVSFPDSNAIWNINIVNSSGAHKNEMLYGLKGDTLINDTLYNKMFILSDTTLNSENLKEYLGGFRQDGSKVWFRPKYEKVKEFLLYDFGMQVGDTIWYNSSLYINTEGGHNFVVDSKFNVVQDINSENNVTRFILYCDYNRQDEYISGIGSIYGPFGSIIQIPLSGNSYHLACFKQNTTVQYQDNLICDKCFCTGLTNTPENKCKVDWVKLYPDHAHNSFSIGIDKPYSKIEIEIFDERGRIIYNEKSLKNPIIINSPYFNFYLLKLTIDDEMIIEKVILK